MVATLAAIGTPAWTAAPIAADQATAWSVDSASVTFEIRNAGLPVRGSFGGFEGLVCFDPDEPETGNLSASVDPATVETGIGMRDRHLARRDYFDVEKYGRVAVRSVRLRGDTASGSDPDRATATRSSPGRVTRFAGTFRVRIRDVEREIEIPFTFTSTGSMARISGEFTLNRLDYGVGGPSVILADDVTVFVALRLSRARPDAEACRPGDARNGQGNAPLDAPARVFTAP